VKNRDELAQTMHENFGVFRREDQCCARATSSPACASVMSASSSTTSDVFNNDHARSSFRVPARPRRPHDVAGVARKESRGAHARPYDYPDRDDRSFLKHTLVSLDDDGRPKLGWKPVTMTKWQPQERKY
jgi:succinate dehydrogenase/fumarate reductase flavoprotein subunit